MYDFEERPVNYRQAVTRRVTVRRSSLEDEDNLSTAHTPPWCGRFVEAGPSRSTTPVDAVSSLATEFSRVPVYNLDPMNNPGQTLL